MASFVLPENMLWWRLDEAGNRYVECLVREYHEGDDDVVSAFYRHWDDEGSTLYDRDGNEVAWTPHGFGRVPIVRVFDARKPRCRNVGHSRYEGIAERQREYYNRDSELILSDTTQAHPLLQGPEDFVQPDGTIPIGPSWLLPKKKNSQGASTTYEGFDVVEFPKHGAESIRRNKADLRDEVDRDSALVRPSGRDGTPQSGLSKMFDHWDGNNRLAKIAKVLQRVEEVAATLASLVLNDGDPGMVEFTVRYPADFDLFTASDVASSTAEFQSLAARAGALPEIEGRMLSRLVRLCLPGLGDDEYAKCDAEILIPGRQFGDPAGRSGADRRRSTDGVRRIRRINDRGASRCYVDEQHGGRTSRAGPVALAAERALVEVESELRGDAGMPSRGCRLRDDRDRHSAREVDNDSVADPGEDRRRSGKRFVELR